MVRAINVDDMSLVNLSVGVDPIIVEFNGTKMDSKRHKSRFQVLLLTARRCCCVSDDRAFCLIDEI